MALSTPRTDGGTGVTASAADVIAATATISEIANAVTSRGVDLGLMDR